MNINDLITYILSFFIPAVKKDLQIQSIFEIENEENEIYINTYFINQKYEF